MLTEYFSFIDRWISLQNAAPEETVSHSYCTDEHQFNIVRLSSYLQNVNRI